MSPLLYNTYVLYFTFEELQFIIVSSVDIWATAYIYIYKQMSHEREVYYIIIIYTGK